MAVLSKTTPSPADLIHRTAIHLQQVLSGDGTGHDWWHVHRVWKTARRIEKEENADLLVVELTAPLHDIADWKLNDGDGRGTASVYGRVFAAVLCRVGGGVQVDEEHRN